MFPLTAVVAALASSLIFAVEVASLILMVTGIIVLARGAPAVTRQLAQTGDPIAGSAVRLDHRG